MNNRAKSIAISAVCSAMALACLLVASFLQWLAVAVSVLAAVAVCIPMLTVKKSGGLFSFLSYLSSVILGCVLGVHNIGYIVIIATYSMPLALLKCYFQNKTLCQKTSHQSFQNPTYQDPFENTENQTDSKTNVAKNFEPINCPTENSMEAKANPTISKVAKWVVFYVICEVSLAVSALSMYLLTPQTLEILLEKNLIWYIVIAANLALPFYMMLLNSCFETLKKPLQRLR